MKIRENVEPNDDNYLYIETLSKSIFIINLFILILIFTVYMISSHMFYIILDDNLIFLFSFLVYTFYYAMYILFSVTDDLNLHLLLSSDNIF